MAPRTGRRLTAIGGALLVLPALATSTTPVAEAASACKPRPDWVDSSPDATADPAPGMTAAVWRGDGHTGIPLTVAAIEADTTRYGFSIATPEQLGAVRRSTTLIAESGAPAGMNGDYYVRAKAGILPKGVEVRGGVVLYAPTGDRRTVGSDARGRIVAGLARVDGELTTFRHKVSIDAVNAVGPRAGEVAAFNSFGARQPHQAAWYVLVRDNTIVSAGSRHPGKLRPGDVLLASGRKAPLATFRRGEPASVKVGVRDITTGRLLRDAVGSGNVILRGGDVVADCTSSFGTSRRPRSVIAWDNGRNRIWLITMNARDAVGMRGGTYGEIADVARYLGADGAVLADGGHSTTLVRQRGLGTARIDAAPGSALRSIPNAVVLRRRVRTMPLTSPAASGHSAVK